MLSEQEARQLIDAFMAGSQTHTISEADFDALTEWATGVRVANSILECVLKGYMMISGIGADGEPAFGLTEEGKVQGANLLQETDK